MNFDSFGISKIIQAEFFSIQSKSENLSKLEILKKILTSIHLYISWLVSVYFEVFVKALLYSQKKGN